MTCVIGMWGLGDGGTKPMAKYSLFQGKTILILSEYETLFKSNEQKQKYPHLAVIKFLGHRPKSALASRSKVTTDTLPIVIAHTIAV